MVLSNIPDKKYHSLLMSFLCDLCGLEGAERLGVRYSIEVSLRQALVGHRKVSVRLSEDAADKSLKRD